MAELRWTGEAAPATIFVAGKVYGYHNGVVKLPDEVVDFVAPEAMQRMEVVKGGETKPDVVRSDEED